MASPAFFSFGHEMFAKKSTPRHKWFNLTFSGFPDLEANNYGDGKKILYEGHSKRTHWPLRHSLSVKKGEHL